MLRHGKYRSGFLERFGIVPSHLVTPSPRPTIWVHAVSVGEVLAVSGLVEQMRARWPAYRIVISTTTDTGQKLARTRFGGENVFYFPIDLGFAIRSYLTSLRPGWSSLPRRSSGRISCDSRNAAAPRIAVVNARISDRSMPWLQAPALVAAQALSARSTLFLAQTYEDRSSAHGIGAPESRVEVTGNLKFEMEPWIASGSGGESSREFPGDRRRARSGLRQHGGRRRRAHAPAGVSKHSRQPSRTQ